VDGEPVTTAADEYTVIRAALIQSKWPIWHAKDLMSQASDAAELAVAEQLLDEAHQAQNALLDRLSVLLSHGGSMRARTSHRTG
jgi:hypothetical protein